jgi:hypothetical protein
MIGTAIASILSSVTANVAGSREPDSPGSKWVVYHMISDVPHPTKDGVSTYDKYRFQLDCWGRTYSDADTLAASVKSAMDGYTGTVSSVVIDLIRFDGEYDGVQSIEEMESREDFFRRIQDYIITVKT